jgi:YidC/Oxa1 family membrane protein insertase
MNIKEWILPIALALITSWFVQRYIVERFFKPASAGIGQISDFIAPQSDQPLRSLTTEVDFIDTEQKRPEITTEVITVWGSALFSSHGAALQTLDFDHAVDHGHETIRTIYPRSDVDRQAHCFLVALNQPTPYFYELVDHYEDDERATLTYKAPFAQGFLIKTFTVHKTMHKIDLHCEVVCSAAVHDAIRVRVLYPSPIMADIAGRDSTSAIIISNQEKFERVQWGDLNVLRCWISPSVFGADNTYFMHALSADPNAFVQRAYFKFVDKNVLVSILEGPEITDSTAWTVSFYCGPKTDVAVSAVDSRLEKTLGYAGFFAPLSKLFLKILILLFDYVGNYGLAIILLTFLIKLVMFPLSMRGDASIKRQQEMAQKMQYLKQRYKDDHQRLALEQQELIKKYGIPGMGCLPVLLQIPAFIAMRGLLANTIQLYHAPFLWIPDLSVRDPYYILPLLLVGSTFAQAATADKTQRMMIIGMGSIFAAVMAQFSAGLVLYFVVYGLLTILQTKVVRYFNIA